MSQIVGPKSNAGVNALTSADDERFHLSAVAIAEISFGIERIRPYERAKHLTPLLEEILKCYANWLHGFDQKNGPDIRATHSLGEERRKKNGQLSVSFVSSARVSLTLQQQ